MRGYKSLALFANQARVKEKRALIRELREKSRIDNTLDKLKRIVSRPTHVEDSVEYLAMRGDYFWDRDNNSTSFSYVLDEHLPTKYYLHISNYGLNLALYVEGTAKEINSQLEAAIRKTSTSKEQERYLKGFLNAVKTLR